MLACDRTIKNHNLEEYVRIADVAPSTLPNLNIGYKTVSNKWSNFSKTFITVFIINNIPKDDWIAEY